jgi:hypothetical protein
VANVGALDHLEYHEQFVVHSDLELVAAHFEDDSLNSKGVTS